MNTIFKREFEDSLFSGRFLVAFIVMLVAFLVSMVMMTQEQSSRLENYEDSFSMRAEELFWNKTFFYSSPEEGIQTSSDTITFPMGVVKKPSPLLFIARGTDKLMRQSVEFMQTFPIIDITIKPDQETNMMKLAFEAPDYLFILRVLVSLLAILFSYNMVCAEKEVGTLKMMMVNGASRNSIFWGKFFGGLSALSVAFIAAFLMYILTYLALSPDSFQGDTWARLLMIMLTSIMHLAVFFAIGAMISTFFSESAPSLIVSLFAWLLIVFALPGVSALLAQQFVPVQSDEKIARKKLEKAQQMEADYAAANPDAGNVSNTAGYGQRHDEIRDKVNAEMKKIDDQHALSKEKQAELTTALARISPIGSVTYVITSLSGNGLADFKLYRQDLIRMRNTINDGATKMMMDPEFGRKYMEGGFEVPMELKEPAFALMEIGQTQGFETLSVSEAIESTLFDYFLIFIFIVLPTIIGYMRFLTYDPR